MIKIDCKKYADEIIDAVRMYGYGITNPKKLVVITAGSDPASEAYMNGKLKDCVRCGIPFTHIRVESQEELMSTIGYYNWKDDVGGIMIQLPLPEGFNEQEAVNKIRIDKDVDGLKPNSKFRPCTPEGILWILKKELGNLSGKTVLLIGKGKLVGRPLIDILLSEGCTLTIAHSQTKNLEDELALYHDAVITSVGIPCLIDLYVVNADVVIDAGVSRNEDGKLCGDCFGFDSEDWTDMRVTTVPNGVGLMTRAMLMNHMMGVQK